MPGKVTVKAKTELEELGEETDGLASSTSKLRGELLALTGVDILEADNKTFKSTYEILKEISEVWSKLSDLSQANVLEKLAGDNIMPEVWGNSY